MPKKAEGLITFKCPRCKEAKEKYWLVCPFCGLTLEPSMEYKKITLYCAICRFPVKPNWKHCPFCGNRVNKFKH